MTDEEGSEVVATGLQICLYSETRYVGEVDDTELASLASDGELERLEVDILTVQSRELRYTQPCRVDTLRYRIVSSSLYRFSRYRREVPLYLLSREECDLSVLYSHEVEGGRIEAGDLLLLQVFEPRPDRDDMCVHRLRGES